MNFQSLLRETFFELAHGDCRNPVRRDLKKCRLRNEPGHLPEIPGFVGRDLQGAVRDKGAVDRCEKIFRYQTARRMAAFRPGIGKHEMKRLHRIPRQQMFDDVGNFEPQDARIR